MGEPVRIQRRRVKGWRMPPNTVNVTRPSRWSNPFIISPLLDRDTSLALFANTVIGIWDPSVANHLPDEFFSIIYNAHHEWLKRINGHPAQLARSELCGKNLACWCALDVECHADVLLLLANQ